jgi:hypothetical protein
MKRLLGVLLVTWALVHPARAADELAVAAGSDGASVPYILTIGSDMPAYAIILMPGGQGILEPRLTNGRLTYRTGGDFLIRSRARFATGPFVAASTDATTSPTRILAIIDDLKRRFGPLALYVVGTSRSTEATMALSAPLDGQVAGFVHTSSMNGIATFDPRRFKSRHLLVLHRLDACRVTRPSAGETSHRTFGTELIEMDGGKPTGEACESVHYHGYNGIEGETADRIKAWIAAGR